jgi:hypothetical protein
MRRPGSGPNAPSLIARAAHRVTTPDIPPPRTAVDRGALVPTLASLSTHTLRGVVTALPSVGVSEGRLRTLASNVSFTFFGSSCGFTQYLHPACRRRGRGIDGPAQILCMLGNSPPE